MYKYILLMVLILTFFSGCKNLNSEVQNKDALNGTNLEDKTKECKCQPKSLPHDIELVYHLSHL